MNCSAPGPCLAPGAPFASQGKGAQPIVRSLSHRQEAAHMKTDRVAKQMSKASADPRIGHPKEGDRFRCESCGMEIKLIADCGCKDGEHVHFECCGKPLTEV